MKNFTLLLTSLLLAACALTAPLTQGAETPTVAPAAATEVAPTATLAAALPPVQPPAGQTPFGKPCGDGVCQGPENAQNCAVDCSAASAAPPSGGAGQGNQPPSATVKAGGEYTVTNPSSGAALYVAVFYPAGWDGQTKLPTLVLVPGGSGNSGAFLKQNPSGSTVDVINQAGYAAVIFDPDGRGKSGGTENYNGFIHQDGLAEVIRFAAALPGVDSANIGLVTYSYGITMGAGALARHPDLPVKFLIDWEGPANRDDTGGCDAAQTGHLKQVASCTDEAFWSEREASSFIGQIRVPYQRIQSQKDHVQPDNAHAILMVNNAVSGGVPWVRLNNETPNQTYDPNNPPAMLPDNVLDRQQDRFIVEYAAELFNR
jgi:pimeloyl-ACP methyl ester carboxylesterase